MIPSTNGTFAFSTQVDTLRNTAEIVYKSYDYDEPLSRYGILPGKENGSITVSFDTINERFSGHFNTTLYLIQNYDGEAHPDSLVIENAEFETGYKN